jgi:hypothetical protein
MPVACRLLHSPRTLPTNEAFSVVDDLISLSERNDSFAQVVDSAHVYSIWLLARWFSENHGQDCGKAHVLFARAITNLHDRERQGTRVQWRPAPPPDSRTLDAVTNVEFARSLWKCTELPGALHLYGDMAYLETQTRGSWRSFVEYSYDLENVAARHETPWTQWYESRAEEAHARLKYGLKGPWEYRVRKALLLYSQRHGTFPPLPGDATFPDLMEHLEPFSGTVTTSAAWSEATTLFRLIDYSPTTGIAEFRLIDPREGATK